MSVQFPTLLTFLFLWRWLSYSPLWMHFNTSFLHPVHQKGRLSCCTYDFPSTIHQWENPWHYSQFLHLEVLLVNIYFLLQLFAVASSVASAAAVSNLCLNQLLIGVPLVCSLDKCSNVLIKGLICWGCVHIDIFRADQNGQMDLSIIYRTLNSNFSSSKYFPLLLVWSTNGTVP